MKKSDSHGVHVERSTILGDDINIAGGDIIHHETKSSITVQDFSSLLLDIKSALDSVALDPDDKHGVETNLEIAEKQSQKSKPNGGLIISSLTTAMNLITQAGGAAKAINTIIPLFKKAISYAQTIF